MSDWKLLNTSTASGASSVEFTDLTGYKIFKFVFIDVGTTVDGPDFQITASTDSGSSYGVTKTTTAFRAKHNEADTSADLAYETGWDLAQSTSNQLIVWGLNDDADATAVGELIIFNPSSTTYVKNFYARTQSYEYSNYSQDQFVAGYWNTTSALTNLKFLFSSGNINSGTFKQYGLVAS